MLRRLHQQMADEHESKLGRRRSKRQRIVHFFKSWKKPHSQHDLSTSSICEKPITEPRSSEAARTTASEQIDTHIEAPSSPIEEMEEAPLPPLLSETKEEAKEDHKDTTLDTEQLHSLFAGAPHFHTTNGDSRPTPMASYPWDQEEALKDARDSVYPSEKALSATSLCDDIQGRNVISSEKMYKGYAPDVVESPSMYSAQGIEPGTTGFAYFLQLPVSDTLATDLEQSQSSKDFLEASRNKEMLQSNPERLGIRQVETRLIYERLVEFQDIYETFHDTPEPMTILNNRSSGDLYANLFTKFLTPPGHDDSIDDPTGLQIQISALIRTLKLRGVWYDFSLVEWRIRLGQVLWSEPEPVPEHEAPPLWTEREILLLQITLACELLLRLDAVTNVDRDDAKLRLQIDPDDIRRFTKSKNRKVDWDLVLARRFLDNILVVKGSDVEGSSPGSSPRGLFSLLGGKAGPDAPKSDLILLPQHQTRQLSGLLYFAKTLEWPNHGSVMTGLARKLGAVEEEPELGSGLSPGLSDPTTPSVISVYGTPLQTPLPANHATDSYFGHIGKPNLTRNDSRALRIPLSPMWPPPEKQSRNCLENVGGWLSRSYLTGLILPGEAISHFLISTLLENDGPAMSALGDSANLYGGFTYADRTFWSKNSIVGRVLACLKGSVECAGWISCPRRTQELTGWHSIHSEQLPYESRIPRKAAEVDVVAQGSAIVPGDATNSVKSEDFVLPLDTNTTPMATIQFASWDLTPINPDLIDDDRLSGPPTESDIYVPSVTFGSQAQPTTLTLAYDVQFVTSWPCNPPTSKITRAASIRPDLRRSLTGTLSRSSSKRSETLSRRNSHGFEPLLSHPPDSTDIAPQRAYEADPEDNSASAPKNKSIAAHLLHSSYLHKIVAATEVLNPDFELTFDLHTSKSSERLLSSLSQKVKEETLLNDSRKAVIVLDARGSPDLELLARAWCAEKGLHALIGRTGRTCVACCIREARGLGMNIVIRV